MVHVVAGSPSGDGGMNEMSDSLSTAGITDSDLLQVRRGAREKETGDVVCFSAVDVHGGSVIARRCVQHHCVRVMVVVLCIVGSARIRYTHIGYSPSWPPLPPSSLRPPTLLSSLPLQQSRPFNQRIMLPTAGDMEKIEEGDDMGELGEEVEEEELTRDKIKRASNQLTGAHERKTKKKRGVHGGGGRRRGKSGTQ